VVLDEPDSDFWCDIKIKTWLFYQLRFHGGFFFNYYFPAISTAEVCLRTG